MVQPSDLASSLKMKKIHRRKNRKETAGPQCLSLILLLPLCCHGTHTPGRERRALKKCARQLLGAKLPKEGAQARRREGARKALGLSVYGLFSVLC